MNERIKLLAEQAGFTTNEANITIGNYQDGNEYFYAEDFIEDELKKFAELIVGECIKVIETNHPEFDCKESADNLIRRAGRMDAIDEINNYFEVEQ